MQSEIDFKSIHTNSYRLVAAVFVVTDLIEKNEDLKTRIQKLSLELVSLVISLKDKNFIETKRVATLIENNSLELMSMLDIASIAGFISKMNGELIRQEFNSFLNQIFNFIKKFEDSKNVSIKDIFSQEMNSAYALTGDSKEIIPVLDTNKKEENINNKKNERPENGHKRKDNRRVTILEFIKRHNNVSIKDIAPNIVGCSEKTIQRELNSLIIEGKISRNGDRRWSRYSVV